MRLLPGGLAAAVVVAAGAHAITAAGGAPLAARVVPQQQAHAAWRGACQQFGVRWSGDQLDRVGGDERASERHSAGAEAVTLLARSPGFGPAQAARRRRGGGGYVDDLDRVLLRGAYLDSCLQQLAD